MRVFIGSSSAYVNKNTDGNFKLKPNSPIKPIIELLEKNKYVVEPWWKYGVLDLGEHFLDSLIGQSKTCDFGLFIFSADDPLIEQEEFGVKDNVLLECGMFFAKNGKRKTCIILDNIKRNKKSNEKNIISEPKVPSNISGHKLAYLSDLEISQKVLDFFERSKTSKHHKRTFYYSKEILDEIIKKDYASWGTKGLYIGTESARQWKEIENRVFKNTTENQKQVLISFINKITNHQSSVSSEVNKLNNIISLGPGAGFFDNIVVSRIYKKNPLISYIPVDINPYLAFEAMELINERPKLRTPFAIIDDFEKNWEYIGEIINEKFHAIKQVNLFMILGGTFCNLSGSENEIFEKFEAWMKKGDYLLLDVFIINGKYEFENDTYRQPATMPDFYKSFIINSVVKKYSTRIISNTDAGNNIIKYLNMEFNKIINVVDDKNNDEKTVLDSTHIATYSFMKDDEVLVAKRYNFDELYTYIDEQNDFEIVESHNGFTDDNIGTNIESETNKSRGLFLIKKIK